MARPVKGVQKPDNEGVIHEVIYLENTTNGHNKFYQIELRKVNSNLPTSGTLWHIRCLYGKIGTTGQEVWHKTNCYLEPYRYFQDLERSKRSKGYKAKIQSKQSLLKEERRQNIPKKGRFYQILSD
jgi:predicted DNA-binding WGR domain protein